MVERFDPAQGTEGHYVRHSDYADLERQIAELRARLTSAYRIKVECNDDANRERHLRIAAEAENARLRALPLKDEVERVLESAKDWISDNVREGDSVGFAPLGRLATLSRLRDGLSEWAGWDHARDPWGETKHKDAVLEALFRGPWSVEDAATLIGFIDRTWTRRPAAPKQGEAK